MTPQQARQRIKQYALEGYSVRRTAKELGLTPGEVTHYARMNGIRFAGCHYGPRSMAMENVGYPTHKRLTC